MRLWATIASLAALSAAIACGVQPVVPGATPTPSPEYSTPATPAPSESPTATPPATASPSSLPPVHSPLHELRIGERGPDVAVMQRELSALGYWLGTADGVFGETTRQAVYALQHAAGLVVDGVVGPATRAALSRGARPTPRTTTGDAIEIDVAHQLLLRVVDGRLQTVIHVSSGGGYVYVQRGVSHRAVTPRGRYDVERKVDGWDVSPLGVLWRPAYFVGGYALHGYVDVPPYPASHGCVRLGIAAMNWLWDNGYVPVGQPVWVY